MAFWRVSGKVARGGDHRRGWREIIKDERGKEQGRYRTRKNGIPGNGGKSGIGR